MTSWTKMNKALLSLALSLSFLTFAPACTEAEKAQMEYKAKERKRAAAEKAVRERAQLYWDLIRWKDWDRASRFFETPESQLAFMRAVSSESAALTRDDIQVQFVFVSTEALEEATLRIGWTEVVPTTGTVAPRLVEQRWYKVQNVWFTHAEQPFGRGADGVGKPGVDPEGLDEEPPSDLPSEAPASSPAASSEASSD